MSSTVATLRAVALAAAVTFGIAGSGFAAAKRKAAPPPPVEVDPAASAIIDAESTFYQGVKTFAVKATLHVRGSGSAPDSISTITAEKPARADLLTVSGKESTRVLSDGITLTVLDQTAKTFFKTKAPPSLAPILRRFAPGLIDLLLPNPREGILDSVTKASFVGEEKIDGAPCQRLHFEQPTAAVDTWTETGAKPLLRRVLLKLTDQAQTEIEVRFDAWRIEPNLSANFFAFTPPKGVTEIHPERDAAKARTEAAKVPPIRVTPGAKLAEDDRKLHHAWCERVLIEPFKARVKGEPWSAVALSFVETAVDDLGSVSASDGPEELAAAGKDLLAQGCSDPLVRYLTAHLAYRVDGNWRPALDTFTALIKELSADASWPRALLCYIGKDAAVVARKGNQNSTLLDTQVIEWTKAALTDGSFKKEDDVAFLKQQISLQWVDTVESRYHDLAAVYAAGDLAEWVRHTLNGYVEVKLAWESRGNGWANTVTEAGWKGFNEHLAKAKTELRQAWKLRPDRPEAPTQMITVTMGGGGDDEETERVWFDRAVAAQFDYMPAYRKLLNAYLPRWNGSHELMLNFGRACRDTRRFDTAVPRIFTDAIDQIAAEYGNWREFYGEHPELRLEIVHYYQANMSEPAHQKSLENWRAWLAARAWACGDYATAGAALDALRGPFDPHALHYLRGLETDLPQVVADVALHAGKGAEEFAQAEALYATSDLVGARAAYEKSAKLAAEKALPLIRSRIAVVDFERAIAGGDWVKIVPSPGLFEWSMSYGNWDVDADGTLINRGDDSAGLIVYRGRVGNAVEVRGEFEIIAPEKCCRSLGVALGYHRGSQAFSNHDNCWLNCTVYQNGHARPVAALFERFYRSDIPQKPFTVEPVNQFMIRLNEGKVTYQVNGQSIYADQAAPANATLAPDGQIGFAAPKFCANNTTKIRHIEVRRIAALGGK